MLPIPDYNTILSQVLAYFRNRFPGKDTHTESFLGKLARALARTIAYLLYSLQSVDQDAVPSTKTSLAALANMAYAYGVPSNQGGFGANGAVAASGGVATFTGTNGQPVPDGTLLTAPDGVTQLKTSGTVTIPGVPPGSGSINANVIAVTAGKAGNLAAGDQLQLPSPPSGIDSTATLATGTAGGLDAEDAVSLLSRILSRWQSPPKGGTATDYRTWAETVAGVKRAYVYPRRSGTGSVDVVITAGGSGTGRKPSAAVRTSTDGYINGAVSPAEDGQRPVTATAYVDLPYVAATGLNLRVRVNTTQVKEFRDKYAFDWALGASTLTVASYALGVITTIETLPTSLTDKVDAYLASPATAPAPRLQVMSATMPEPGIAVPVKVVNYNAGAKTLTLESPLPAGWTPPSAADPIYPYGPVVPLVAQGAVPTTAIAGVQGYVDSLGPSRQSGYANPLDVWDDECRVFNVGQTALDTTDTDGTKPVASIPAGGVTINGGTADVQAVDDANGIQILWVQKLAVTD